jgi:hypothetical protein
LNVLLKDGEKMVNKKTESAKTVKTAAPVKAETVKTETAAPVKAEVKTAEPKKAEIKAAEPKKVAEKRATAKKTTVKKTENEKNCSFYIQFAGKQFSYEEVVEKCKEAAAAEMGKKVTSVKSIDVYCKPEEHAAYYVANGNKIAGRIDL